MKKKLLLLFLMISGITYSQISITYSDYSHAFSPGSIFNSYSTPINLDSTVSVFVGEASATAQYWDFTNYTFNHLGVSVGIVPATAPLINAFPSSNFVLYEKGWFLGTDTLYIWNYKELQSDKLLLLGLSTDTSIFTIYDPPAMQAQVPLTYGATWNVANGSATVDAFGTMKLPSGEYECLRIRWDNLKFQRAQGLVYAANSRSYTFYSKEVREVNVLSIPPEQFDQTTVHVMSFSFSDREWGSGISEKAVPLLAQNCPNPFHSQTAISYSLASGGMVMLRIYDFLGKEVATPVNEVQSAGTHEVIYSCTGMLPGVYYYKLTCGNYTVTKKMLISG